ncbi:hypothetical protein A2763_00740 [Candidatus Kaiserbacteria bacterium RIFCSPHIGHO2_01_FULL_54_36]|uniref:Uncharacterized protein n=1 Tax=Candidatus Kaiserbacteria bacterium RIFCSPHIGHO2_01_FULL_54_36 TaxID=1798482 RepID=A0A1F6CNR5_9BACT|nr:MAG: hypothetical protein A2763_00740 [Candidatus Kaiserbacteria bacterium RIFCSPHIGHO2_01_FULL_54_36]OGG75555.1 MAG: hypothetical protein A3A41_02945 [Candidatus Kaiserbacteria bacterium RIFCSPLOWO2_01_FULL_54_22]
MQLILTLLAFVAGIATAIAMPATFIAIPYLSQEMSQYVTILVANGVFVGVAYAVLNALDATPPQTSKFLYWLSAVGSFIPWLSLTGTTIFVTLNRWSGGQLNSLSDINGAMALLYALTAFAQLDFFYLQRQKWRALRRGEHRAPDAPAHVPVIPPATTDNWGGAVAAIAMVLLIGLGVLIYQLYGSGDSSQQSAAGPTVTLPPIDNTQASVPRDKGHNDNRGVCEVFPDGSRLC